MTSIQLPQNRSLSEQVCELIENEIINGNLIVGAKIPTEKELSEMYKVSRTVIREATKILKEKGRLASFVGKGTFVIDETDRGIGSSLNALIRSNPGDSFENLIQIREILEPEMAALAALNASDEQIAEMQKMIDIMNQSLEDKNLKEDFLKSDYKFHNLLAEATGNPLLTLLVKPLGALMRNQQQFIAFDVVDGPVISQKGHNLIFEAIKNRNPDIARAVMHDHIRQVFLVIHDK